MSSVRKVQAHSGAPSTEGLGLSYPTRFAVMRRTLGRTVDPAARRLVIRRTVRMNSADVPLYRYYCPHNDITIEVHHAMRESVESWGELCARADHPVGATDPQAPVERHLFPPAVHTPLGDTQLKSKGFTKLVRREKGVYENVTALDGEKRYVKADDPSSMPDFKGRNLD